MSAENSNPADEIMCDCSGTTRGKIYQLCDQGMIDLETISRKTGAMSGCASCEWDIENLVDDYVKQIAQG